MGGWNWKSLDKRPCGNSLYSSSLFDPRERRSAIHKEISVFGSQEEFIVSKTERAVSPEQIGSSPCRVSKRVQIINIFIPKCFW